MEKTEGRFTHGLVVIDPANDTSEQRAVIHFVGFWTEPSEEDIAELKNELKTSEEFGLQEIADTLLIESADQTVVDYMNHVIYDEPTKDTIQDRWDHLTEEQQSKYTHLLPTVSLASGVLDERFQVNDVVLDGDGIVYLIVE